MDCLLSLDLSFLVPKMRTKCLCNISPAENAGGDALFCTSTIEEKVYQQSLDLENSLLVASSSWKGIFPLMREKSVCAVLQKELERDNVGEIITPMGKFL